MKSYFSNYYQSTITSNQLITLVKHYQVYCVNEGLVPVYSINDVLVAIDDKCVDQDLINQFITYYIKDMRSKSN
jgi:hypothetical protein